MLHLVENLQFKADIPFVTQDSPCFKSLSYPPKDEFVMSINHDGEVVSRFGDDTWDFTPFFSSQKLQFKEYDESNKALFKQLMYYLIYSHLFPGKYSSLGSWYKSYQNIFRACSKAEIKASELSRFPIIIEEMAESYSKRSPSNYSKSIWHYDVILKNQDQVGFTLLSERGIAIYKKIDSRYDYGQTPYIPHSIWTNLIKYLDSVLDDFELYQDKLEKVYHYIAHTSLLNESNGIPSRYSSPFSRGRMHGKKYYPGTFEEYLNTTDVMALIEKYSERSKSDKFKTYRVDQFGAILNNILISCYLYILFYSIMRKNEALSLRLDCLKMDHDEQTGNFYMLVGETTKTESDSDARWIVPKRVVRAVSIAKKMVEWKLQYIPNSSEFPYLFQNINVWQEEHRNENLRVMKSFSNVLEKSSFFFNPNQFKITKDDYDEAIALTPSLANSGWFKIGGVWNFSYHQFRRTLAVYFALNKVSSSSTQLQMKHGTREQQFHYQNNAGRLRINHLAEQEVVNEYYAEMARNIASVVHSEKILPHKNSPVKKEIVSFVERGEMKKLLEAQKNGAVGYRKNLLGGCMKQGPCEYGGFDSIVQCAGGKSGNMCSDLIIDEAKEQEFEEDKVHYEIQMEEVSRDSPRYGAFKVEVRAYENVLAAIKRRQK